VTTPASGSPFHFSIPSLPKEWYTTVQAFRASEDLTQWQVVILALACLKLVAAGQPDQVKTLSQQVKEMYPHGHP